MSMSFVFYETFTKQLKCLDAETRCRFYDAIAEYGLYEIEPDFTGIELSVWIPIKESIDNAKARREKSIDDGKKGGRPETPQKVQDNICEDLKNGLTQKEIAEKHNISQQTVSNTKKKVFSTKKQEVLPNTKNGVFSTKYQKPSSNTKNLDVDVDVDVDDISSLDILPNLERGGQSENPQTADKPPEQAEPAPFSEIPKPEKKRKCFVKPNIPEIASYCNERKNGVDPVAFYNFYESKDWYVGKNKMKNWRACVHTWEQRQHDFKKQHPPFTQNDFSQQDFSESSIPEALRSKQKIEIDIGEALESVPF